MFVLEYFIRLHYNCTMTGIEFKKYFQLISSGLSLVWLFLKSPLNPLYSQYSHADMHAVRYEFYLWIFIFGFFIWLIFFVNRRNYEHHLTKILIFSTAFLYLVLIPYGYETTDTGFTLSKQWAMFNGMWSENFDAIAGTNLIGGIWLMIPGVPSLLWARFGFVILQTLIVFFIFLINASFFGRVKAFALVLFFTFTTSFFQYYHTINYDNLPFLLLLISIYFTIKDQKNDGSEGYGFFISGFFISLCMFCKITYISALLIPVFFIIHKKSGRRFANLYKYFAGFICGLAATLIFMVFSGSFSSYVEYFRDILTDFLRQKSPEEQTLALRDHSATALTKSYGDQFLKTMINSIILLPVIFSLHFISKRIKNKYFYYMLTTVSGSFIYWRVFNLSGDRANTHIGILSLLLSIYLIACILPKDGRYGIFFVGLIFIIVFVQSFIGSDLGVTTSFRCGAGILLASVVYSIMLSGNEISIRSQAVIFATLPLFVIFFFVKDYRPYREQNMGFLHTGFDYPPLAGIVTNKYRSAVADSLYLYLNGISNLKQKKIFFSKGNALGYYLTGTVYPHKSPWDTINKFDDIKDDFMIKAPDYFIFSYYTHRDPIWPEIDIKWYSESLYEEKAQRFYDFYRNFIAKNNYIEVYKNSFYTVYELKEGSGGDVRTEE
jgi:hypothetical protein